MRKLLKTAALSATAALGIAAAAPAAQAEGLYLGFGNTGGFAVTTVDTFYPDRTDWHGGPRHWQERRGEWRHGEWRRADDWRRGPPLCSPGRALAKAERLGLRRVWLRDVDRETIRVSGNRRGERFTVTFARTPSCPVIRF